MRPHIHTRATPHRTRFLLCALTMAGLVGCQGSYVPQRASPGELRMREAADALLSIRMQEPALQWYSRSDSLASDALARRPAGDAELLSARLYHDLAVRLTDPARTPATDAASVRQVVTASRPVESRNRAYYDALLADTRSRMSRDVEYQRQIRHATTSARLYWNGSWSDFACVVDGFPMPKHYCTVLMANFWYESWNVVTRIDAD